MIGIIRTLIIISVLFAGRGIASKFFPSIKNCNNTLFSLVVGLMVFFSCLFPPESAFLSFDSPEDSYSFSFSGEPVLTVEGTQSALVVSNKEGNHSALIVPKKDTGWGECITLDTNISPRVTRILESELLTFVVYFHESIDDVYLAVEGRSDFVTDVSDNAGSVFYTIPSEASGAESTSCYAHLNSWSENHQITVDGITYQIYTATPIPVA